MKGLSLLLGLLLVPGLGGQKPPSAYATKVVAYQKGPGVVAPFDDPKKALGAPAGNGHQQGSLDVVTLGTGGSLTLGFDAPIMDGQGADFLVFENAFFVANTTRSFAEVVFVEVSSNGTDFARFPVSYLGPQTSLGPFGALLPGTWEGLAGASPVYANPLLRPALDPRDPARAGGEAFDLEDLRDHPLVKSGKVNLFRILHLRLVDVPDGIHRDRKGRLIRDASGGSADIDGVAVLHFLTHQSPNRPVVRLGLTPGRKIRFELSDPDGLSDLDPWSVHLSVQGLPLDFWAFLGLCKVLKAGPKGLVLETAFALPPALPIKLSASARDRGGWISGDSVHLH